MRQPGFLRIIALVLILLDIYIFQAVKMLSQQASPKVRLTIYTVYWTVSIAVILLLLLMPYLHYDNWPKPVKSYVFAIIVGLFLSKLIASVFFLVDDIRRLMTWIATRIFRSPSLPGDEGMDGITRSAFLTWLGVIAGGGLFTTLMYGFRNKYRYEVRRLQLSFEELPPAFKHLKIVQISDIHSGSFMNKEAVMHGVEKILKEKADIILFTGDLVNDKATEMKDYMDVFSKLKAPMGVYSTLGNHDYGDYVSWPNDGITKEQNLENVKKIHADLGWRLLMNEHVILRKGDDAIALIGIENWSAKARFPKHGRMDLAYPGTEPYPFKILMSHDPSHWDAQVRPMYSDINLTLSGHTHGMQFGVELPGFKWSPVQYMYQQWAGLYEEGRQKLYVNRGYGFIGYPGRVGILPEITVIELV